MLPHKAFFYPSRQPLVLVAFCDSDWGACLLSYRFVSGYCIQLGHALVSWKSKKQSVVSRSSAKAEYRAIVNTCCNIVWLTRLLADFLISVSSPVPLYCVNASAIHLARNLVFHERTKHVELDCHFVRQQVSSGLISSCSIASTNQPADILMKPLSSEFLKCLSSKLNVQNLLHTLGLRAVLKVLMKNETRASRRSTRLVESTQSSLFVF